MMKIARDLFCASLIFASGITLADGRSIALETMTFDGVVPSSATLSSGEGSAGVTNVIAVCWDSVDRGNDFDAWANHKFLVYAPPDMTSAVCEVPAAVTSGWNTSVKAMRYFLVSGTPYVPGADAYVQRGLLAHFDGIENVAYGEPHDSTKTKWNDLTGNGYNWTLGSICSWEDNALYFSGSGNGGSNAKSSASDWSEIRTMEMLYKADALQGVLFSSSINNALYSYISQNKITVTEYWGYPVDTSHTNSVAAVYEDADLVAASASFTGQMYWNGEPVTAVKLTDYWNTGSLNSIGNRRAGGGTGGGSRSKGHMYSLRFYTNQLTAAEIAHNYEIDSIRYLGAISLLNVISHGATSATTPASAPVTITAVADNVSIGQVTKNAADYHFGDTVTLSAVPLTPHSQFRYWTGDLPENADIRNPSLTFIADCNRTVSAHFAEVNVYYVREGGNDATAIANDIDHPYATVNAAVSAAADECLVDIGPGTFSLTEAVTVDKSLTVKGAGTNATVITRGASGIRAFVLSDDNAELRDMTVSNFVNNLFGAAISMTKGLVENCRITYSGPDGLFAPKGGGINMSGGTVRSSLIDHCDVDSCSSTRYGGGIYMTDGLVEDCDFVGNIGTMENSNGRGSALCVSKGVVRRCRFSGNRNFDGNSSGGALYCDGSNVTIEACRFESNTPLAVNLGSGKMFNSIIAGGHNGQAFTAGVVLSGGKLYNCTFYGNAAGLDASGCSAFSMSSGSALNNVFWKNGGSLGGVNVTGGTFNTNIVDNVVTYGVFNRMIDPQFVDESTGDFRLSFGSPAVDLGVTLAEVAADIVGVARPQGCGYDIGAYEFVPGSGFQAAMQVSPAECGAGDPVAFTSVVSGEAKSYRWYVDGMEAGTAASMVLSSLSSASHDVRLIVTDMDDVDHVVEKESAVIVRPKKVFVSVIGQHVAPFDSAENAATNIEDAVATLWQSATATSIVEIAAGEYLISGEIGIGTPVKILGAGADTTTIGRAATGYRAFSINDDGAEIAGLTITGFRNELDGGAIKMSKGLVRDCVIENSYHTGREQHGGGVYMSGGELLRCTVRGNSLSALGGFRRGAGIYMSGGIVDDCDIYSNTTGKSNNNDQGEGVNVAGGILRNSRIHDNYGCMSQECSAGVYVTGADALVENCEIYGNRPIGLRMNDVKSFVRNCLITANSNATAVATGVSIGGGTLENCTITANLDSSDALPPGLRMTKGKAVNNIVWGNGANYATVGSAQVTGGTFSTNLVDVAVETGVGNIAGDPRFKSPARNDWCLRSTSPAINKGALLDWMSESAVDLDGTPRIRNKFPDLGCYEGDLAGFMMMVR